MDTSRQKSLSALTLAITFALIAGSSRVSARRHSDVIAETEVKSVHHRSGYCVNAFDKCYSSGQCCKGLVCAARDDYFGQKPEEPGYCVKEKDLEACTTAADCGEGVRCMPLGRTGERYCLPRPQAAAMMASSETVKSVPEAAHMRVSAGGLGSPCVYTSDCRPHADNGVDKLCCQNVSRGRQGIRRLCDRVTPISSCISAPRK